MKYVIRHTVKFKVSEGQLTDMISSESVIIKKKATSEYFETLKNRARALNQNYRVGINKNTFFQQRGTLGTSNVIRQTFELVTVADVQKRYLDKQKAARSRQ